MEYRRALKMYESGRAEEGLALAGRLSRLELRVVPDSGPDSYATFNKTSSALVLLHNVWLENHYCIQKMEKSGKLASARRFMKVNFLLNRQMIHMMPNSSISIIYGNNTWSATLADANTLFSLSKDASGLARVKRSIERSDDFFKRYLQPMCGRDEKELKDLKRRVDNLPKNKQREYEDSEIHAMETCHLTEARNLVAIWDKGVECGLCRACALR